MTKKKILTKTKPKAPLRKAVPTKQSDKPKIEQVGTFQPGDDRGAYRFDVLREAFRLTSQDRNRVYGPAKRNLDCQAALKKVYRLFAGDKYSPSHDEAIDLVIQKLARIACGKSRHQDNYVDAAAYLAIAYECEEQTRAETEPKVDTRKGYAKD